MHLSLAVLRPEISWRQTEIYFWVPVDVSEETKIRKNTFFEVRQTNNELFKKAFY